MIRTVLILGAIGVVGYLLLRRAGSSDSSIPASASTPAGRRAAETVGSVGRAVTGGIDAVEHVMDLFRGQQNRGERK